MTRIQYFDATRDSSLAAAMNSPHDPECFWADEAAVARTLQDQTKPPPCECRKALKIRAAARTVGV